MTEGELRKMKKADLVRLCVALERRVAHLTARAGQAEQRANEASWEANPDRSGGAFTQWEKDNAKAWR